MACGARAGLKGAHTLQWHLGEGRWKQAQPGSQKSRWLAEMSLERRGRLLQHGDGQFMGGSQTQRVAVVADLPMGAPGASRDPPRMVGREVTVLADKAKRGLRSQPGKPLRSVGRKREQASFWAEHD